MKCAPILVEREGGLPSPAEVVLECVKWKVPKRSESDEPRMASSKGRGAAPLQSVLSLDTNAFSTASGSGADSLNHTSTGPERSCRIGVTRPQ